MNYGSGSIWNIVILDKPNQKITENTQIIAVRMLNSNSLTKTNNWRDYRVSVDEIEQNTGLDFLTNIPKNIQDKLEGKVDYR